MKRISLMLSGALLLGALSGCFTVSQTVGRGPTGKGVSEHRAWFCCYGLFALGDVPDAKQLSGGAKDYRVTTEFTAVDVIIGIFTSAVTIMPKTVRVEK